MDIVHIHVDVFLQVYLINLCNKYNKCNSKIGKIMSFFTDSWPLPNPCVLNIFSVAQRHITHTMPNWTQRASRRLIRKPWTQHKKNPIRQDATTIFQPVWSLNICSLHDAWFPIDMMCVAYFDYMTTTLKWIINLPYMTCLNAWNACCTDVSFRAVTIEIIFTCI